ncbi:hypothetical protein PUN28_014393 [Cardiocondyla obscurior]|uniref:Secreted protein n=1 Tax=Cardiocondyla obscurior TaxID=286306 RepID=A0AAW2EZY3_9HYME
MAIWTSSSSLLLFWWPPPSQNYSVYQRSLISPAYSIYNTQIRFVSRAKRPIENFLAPSSPSPRNGKCQKNFLKN